MRDKISSRGVSFKGGQGGQTVPPKADPPQAENLLRVRFGGSPKDPPLAENPPLPIL